jgi:hypothetical protein
VSPKAQPPGCRNAAIATALLVGTAVVFMVLGLTLVNDPGCVGLCQDLGFTLLYAGIPISAVFGVVFGDLVVAWPLDITLWVVTGFLLARHADHRGRNVLGLALLAVIVALLYGLVLSRFVEIAI